MFIMFNSFYMQSRAKRYEIFRKDGYNKTTEKFIVLSSLLYQFRIPFDIDDMMLIS